jgi:hypothetical protein
MVSLTVGEEKEAEEIMRKFLDKVRETIQIEQWKKQLEESMSVILPSEVSLLARFADFGAETQVKAFCSADRKNMENYQSMLNDSIHLFSRLSGFLEQPLSLSSLVTLFSRLTDLKERKIEKVTLKTPTLRVARHPYHWLWAEPILLNDNYSIKTIEIELNGDFAPDSIQSCYLSEKGTIYTTLYSQTTVIEIDPATITFKGRANWKECCTKSVVGADHPWKILNRGGERELHYPGREEPIATGNFYDIIMLENCGKVIIIALEEFFVFDVATLTQTRSISIPSFYETAFRGSGANDFYLIPSLGSIRRILHFESWDSAPTERFFRTCVSKIFAFSGGYFYKYSNKGEFEANGDILSFPESLIGSIAKWRVCQLPDGSFFIPQAVRDRKLIAQVLSC